MPGVMQGIRIENGGIAESVNMATLVYEHWQKEGNKLLLKGKSLGNGQTIIFTDTLHIETLSADSGKSVLFWQTWVVPDACLLSC